MKTSALLCGAALLWACTNAVAVPLERVSVDSAGHQSAGSSSTPAISANSRIVVFTSTSQFGFGSANGRQGVFAKDRVTGLLERISDDRGGDQPSVSSDGNFVTYRSLEDLPKVRKFDRRSTGPRNSVSYPFGNGQSRRFGDLGQISTNGAWTAFIFRPEPSNLSQTGHFVVRHSTEPGPNFDDAQTIIASNLRDVFRTVVSNSGLVTAFVTSEPLVAGDTNALPDVYIHASGVARLLSALPGNVSGVGAAFDLAFSAGANRLVFLSDSPLLPADSDGRTSLYMATSADGFTALQWIETPQRPVALGPQGVSSTGTIAYTAVNASGIRSVHLTNGVGTHASVPESAGITGTPAISAEGSSIVFATAAALVANDTNAARDIYVADISSLFGDLPRALPTPMFGNISDGQLVNPNTNVSILCAGADPNGTISELQLEIDGVLVDRRNLSSFTFVFNRPTGIYRLTLRAFNDSIVAAERTIALIVQPPATKLGIIGAQDVATTPLPDGSLAWQGQVRVMNRTGTTRNFRLALNVAPTAALMGPNVASQANPGFPDENLLPERVEELAFVTGTLSIPNNTTALVDASALLPATEVISNGLQGIGWSLVALLVDEGGGTPDPVSQVLYFHRPALSEKTNGPNGGTTLAGSLQTSTLAPPPVIIGLQLQTPANVPEFTTRRLTALAIFSNGPPIRTGAIWSLVTPTSAATLSSSGVLTARNVTLPAAIRVRAQVPGVAPAEATITIRPIVPVVSVVASDASAGEINNPGRFRIVRSASLNEAITVNFTIGGTAIEGTHFTPISRSVSLPANVTRAFVDVLPIENSVFEGTKTITLNLLDDPAFIRRGTTAATVKIADDEPPPPRQPDILLQNGITRIGTNIFEDGNPLFPLTQVVKRKIAAGKTTSVVLEIFNRGSELGTYALKGAPDFSGFRLQYLDGKLDVTAAMTTTGNAGHLFTLAPKTRRLITVRVTASADAPLGFEQRLPIQIVETSANPTLFIPDTVEIVATRKP